MTPELTWEEFMKEGVKHLASDHIDKIALSLDEDVYGASGPLSEWQIRERLIEQIRSVTDYQHGEMVPINAVAGLILGVWEYKDRQYMEEVGRRNQAD